MVNFKKFFSKEKSNLNSTKEKSNLISTKEYSSLNSIKRKSPRKAGTGGLSKIKKNNKEYYRGSYTTGYNKFGTQQRKYFYEETKDIALQKLESYIASGYNTPLPPRELITFDEWLKYYLYEYSCITSRAGSFEKNEGIYRNYFSEYKELINTKLIELTTFSLQDHYNSLIEFGCDPITLKNNNKFIQAALNSAISYGYLNMNVAGNVKFPIATVALKQKNFLALADRDKFISALDNSTLSILLKFILFSGVRIGEALSLTWSDIDFNNNTIKINKSLDKVSRNSLDKIHRDDFKIVFDNPKNKNVLILVPPKNKYSFRNIPLAESLVVSLKYLLLEYNSNCTKDNYIDNNLVFCNSLGGYLDSKAPGRLLSKILISLNINNLTPHELRHTFATILYENNIDTKVISGLLGHKIDKKTTDIYAHVTDEMKIDAIKKLNNSLNIK